jgi:photosystem II stability/assembly factor-like uncharacterized protein
MLSTKQLLFRFVLILFFYFGPQSTFSQFKEIYKSADPNDQVAGISFINSSTGYVAFKKFVGYTQDGGKNFIVRTISYANTNFNGYAVGLTFGFSPRGVVAFSADSLLVYGEFSTEPSILFSSNGGQTWKLVFHRGVNWNASIFNEGITDIEFPGNGAVGYAVHHEQILKTTNRGQTWVPVLNTPNQFLRKLSCPSPGTAYATGGDKLYKTTTGGISWVNQPPPANNTYPDFNNVYFISDLVGYASDVSSAQVYKTSNGGALWSKMNDRNVVPADGNDLYFINDSTGFLAPYSPYVLKTTDSGKTWEPCKTDKAPQGENNGLYSLFFLNSNIGWAGGVSGRLLLTTDGSATATWPKAYFGTDVSNVVSTGMVNLVNYSKPGYNYSWFKNGQYLSGSYHASYFHATSVLRDTIKLIVWNNLDSDTLERYIDFSPAITITSFSPEVGYANAAITIRGNDFFNVNSVSFGGVPARYFRVKSTTEIYAEVGIGASGDVKITNPSASGSKSGFVFLAEPRIDQEVKVQDTMLCKEEPVIVIIQNTEADVRYELWDANKSIALGNAKGTGGELRFTSLPLTNSGTYNIWATRSYLSTSRTRKLAQSIRVTVEHTRSVFAADKVNVAVNEPVNFSNYSAEASSFAWIFSDNASISSSTSPKPAGIAYANGGQKSLTLISTSSYGCTDTLIGKAVFVYNAPVPEDVCYANNTADDDSYELQGVLNDMSRESNDGYTICGIGNNPLIKSRYGIDKKINGNSVSHVAKYTRDGILRWVDYIVGGNINGSVTDNDGNTYITGFCYSAAWFHFNDGDSMTFVPKNATSLPTYDKASGFILKVNAAGKYIWHTLIFDPSLNYQGYPVQGGYPVRITLRDDQLVVIGSCLANLSYYQNGLITPIMSFSNSVYENDNQNNFILNISTDGKYNWSVKAKNRAPNQRRAFSDAAIDASGNTYISGYYEGGVEIYDAANSLLTLYGSTGSSLGYLLKLNSQGQLLWNMRMTDVSTTPKAIAIEPSGMVYVTGASGCSDASQRFLIQNTDGTTTPASYGGYFLMKVYPTGKTIWTQGSRYAYYGGGSALYCDGDHVYAAGTVFDMRSPFYQYTFTSTGGDITNFTTSESEFFLAKYDTSGKLIKINTSGLNAGGHTMPTRLFADSKKNLLIGGYTDYWNGGNGQHSIFGNMVYPTSSQDAFYARINPDFCGNITWYPKAGNDTLICAGSPVTLGLRNPNGYTYNWKSSDGSLSATTPVVTVNPVASTTYYVSLVNPSGIVTRDTVIIKVLSIPIANAGVDKELCSGKTSTIGVTSTGDTYQWTSLPAGFTSSEANPLIAPTVTTRYFLVVKNAAECMAFDTVVVKVSAPIAIAGPDKDICRGSNLTIGVTDYENTCEWTSLPAGFISSVSNPLVSPQVSTRFFLAVKNAAGCVVYDTVDVNVLDVPVANAGLDKDICAGSNVFLGVAGTGNTYQWTSQPAGFTSSVANPVVAPQVTTRYFLAVKSVAGCMAYDTVDVKVNVLTANAGPDKDICTGGSVTIGVIGTGNTYQWTSLPAGFTSTLSNPLVAPTVTTRYFLLVKNAAGCMAYDTVDVKLNAVAANAGPDKEICTGSGVTIGVAGTGNTYQWTSQPAGFTSSVANPVVAPWSTTRYFLAVKNATGCMAYDTVDVKVNGVVAIAGFDKEICAGSSITLGAASTGNTYQWTSQPAGFTSSVANPIVAPQITTRYFLVVKSAAGCIAYDTVDVKVNALTANAGPDKDICTGGSVTIGVMGTGNTYQWTSQPAGFTSSLSNPVVAPQVTTRYLLVVRNAAGCVAYDTVDVNVNILSANAGPDKEICAGSSVIIGAAGTGNTYQWTSQPAGFTSSVANPLAAPQITTRYFLTVRNAGGCIGYDTVDVSVKPLPAKPVILKGAGDSLISSVTQGNQWFIDTTTLISGATNQQFKPTADGVYSVKVTQNGCTGPFSDKFEFKIPIVTGINDPDNDGAQVYIFPNPAHERIKIIFRIEGVRQLNASMFDGRGRQLSIRLNMNSGDELPVAQLAPGIYYIVLNDNKNKVRVIRQLAVY